MSAGQPSADVNRVPPALLLAVKSAVKRKRSDVSSTLEQKNASTEVARYLFLNKWRHVLSVVTQEDCFLGRDVNKSTFDCAPKRRRSRQQLLHPRPVSITAIGHRTHTASVAFIPKGPTTTAAPEESAKEMMDASFRLLTLQAQASEVVNQKHVEKTFIRFATTVLRRKFTMGTKCWQFSLEKLGFDPSIKVQINDEPNMRDKYQWCLCKMGLCACYWSFRLAMQSPRRRSL